MNNEGIKKDTTWENKLFAIGFIKDVSEPYFAFAERLSKPATYFRNDELWNKYYNANALGDYWLIIRYVIENAINQRKIFIANVPIAIIEDKRYSHKLTLAETRFIGLPNFKYVHHTHNNCEVFLPTELDKTYKSFLPNELIY